MGATIYVRSYNKPTFAHNFSFDLNEILKI